jgi:hypothetical protein
MAFLWRKVCRFARKPKIGVLLACAVVASSSISLALALAPSAEALSSTTKNSTTFAGYVATPAGTSSESAQVSFDVPTLTCTRQSMEQDVFMFQYMEYSEGNYAEAWVDVECGNGIAEYDADADACGFTGCGGCSSSSISVSPGDSVMLSENVSSGNDAPAGAEVTDLSGTGGSVLCQEFGAFPTPGPVYTGICGQDHATNGQPDSAGSAKPPPFGGCSGGNRPEFTPVAFTGTTVDGLSLGSWSPTQYDMVSGTGTLQVRTRNLKDSGESFKDVFENH